MLNNYLADFRSDTVTKPTKNMLEFMMKAEVGDDVLQEDPTVNQLETRMAELAGKESALFCTSGTLSNQLAVRSHLVQPPYSVICDKRAHVNCYESGGISFHNGAHVIPIDPRGSGLSHLTASLIENEIIPPTYQDVHHAPTHLICLENTLNGTIFPHSEQEKIKRMVARYPGIGLHLDGARIWNAMVANKMSLKQACEPYDSVSICFSKGLGSPFGSVLVGSNQFIKKARHFRKIYGGGMRQIGIMAAACLYSYEHHLKLLLTDHENARYLASRLEGLGFRLSVPCETSMVWIDCASLKLNAESLSIHLKQNGVLTYGGNSSGMRLVVHHQISREAIDKTVEIIANFIKSL